MKPKNKKEEMKAISLHMEEMKPTLRLREDDLKEIKDWEVGEDYTLVLEVTQDFKEIDDGKYKAGFKINKVKAK